MILRFADRVTDFRRSTRWLANLLLLGNLYATAACNDDDTEARDAGDVDVADSGEAEADASDDSPAADAGSDAAVEAPSCTGKPGSLRGRSVQTLMAAGLQRRFVYYAPPTLDANKAAPVLLVAHGFLMNGDMMEQISGFEAIADREGFVVMFPDGQGERASMPGMDPPWNVGKDVCQPNGFTAPVATGDDQAFVDAMLDFARDDQCVDEDHLFLTGFSMGGYFANHSGCVRSDLAGVAPHSAGSHELSDCEDKKPVLLMHFEQDALIPYSCGTQARDRWLARNGCDAAMAPTERSVKGGVCAYYKGCPKDAQVAMCTFQAPTDTSDELFLGHAWSGGDASQPTLSPFTIPETENAAELVWGFFKEYAW